MLVLSHVCFEMDDLLVSVDAQLGFAMYFAAMINSMRVDLHSISDGCRIDQVRPWMASAQLSMLQLRR